MHDTIHPNTSPDELSPMHTNRADRTRSLDALHLLELHAGSATPGREPQWLDQVRTTVAALEVALETQQTNSATSTSVLSDIERTEPRLHRRVTQLRENSRNLLHELRALRDRLDAAQPDDTDVADLRQRVERLGTELRQQRAREADLVYEAYNVDLGAGD